MRERGEDDALQAIALMKQGEVVDLTAEIALEAAKISFDHKIPMADSVILATAWTYEATIWIKIVILKNSAVSNTSQKTNQFPFLSKSKL